MELATKIESATEVAVLENKDTALICSRWHLLSALEEGDVRTIHGPLAAGSEHMTVSGTR